MKKYQIIERIYDPYLKRSLERPLIMVLIGPRQSGKTTSADSLLKEIPVERKFYLNLDSSFERERVRGNEFYLEEKIEEVLGYKLDVLRDKFYLFIDEAQKLPLIFESIKILYDKYQHVLKIILSGSSGLELLDKTAETLAGRVQIIRIYPFSMCEASVYENISGFEHTRLLYSAIFSGSLNKNLLSHIFGESKPKSNKKMQLISKLITRSLFPPTFSKIEEDDIPRWLVDYLDTYLERDMRSVRDIGNIEGYRKVIVGDIFV
jgi:predicted AAA+ superfamily ATPase